MRQERELDQSLQLYTLTEVARATGVSVRTVYRWIKDGRLKGVHINPRQTKIWHNDLQDFIQRFRDKDAGEQGPRQQPIAELESSE